MRNSKIEWTDHTVNLWWGCHKVNTGCLNCYAEKMSNRFNNDLWGKDAKRKVIYSAFSNLEEYQKKAAKKGIMSKVFIGSMMDIFETLKDPVVEFQRDVLFENISEGKYPNLTFLFLTKRPANLFANYIMGLGVSKICDLKNVWFGISVSDQETSEAMKIIKNKMVDKNFNLNLFLSIEPQVGPIDNIDLRGIKWVIQGGESGKKRRPFDIKWAERMRDICKEQGVPYFFKQIDKVKFIPEHLRIREFPEFVKP